MILITKVRKLIYNAGADPAKNFTGAENVGRKTTPFFRPRLWTDTGDDKRSYYSKNAPVY